VRQGSCGTGNLLHHYGKADELLFRQRRRQAAASPNNVGRAEEGSGITFTEIADPYNGKPDELAISKSKDEPVSAIE